MRREYTPRPYGPLATSHLLEHPRCALWAPPGMGKTVLVYTVLDILMLAGELERPVLVVAPPRVAQDVWPKEASKWAHLGAFEVSAIVGDVKAREAALKRDVPVYTTNYEQLPWLVERLGERWPFETIIPDEATKLKGFRTRQGTARAAALASVAWKYVKRVVELTGTPSPNGLKDLWGQIWFLDRGERLGRTYTAFVERWFQAVPGGDGFSQIRPLAHAQAEIQDRLRDICLTLDPKDYFTLLDPVVNPIYIDLPATARAQYQDMERRMYLEIDDSSVEAFNAAAKTMKCLQLANGAIYTDEQGTWSEVHTVKLQTLDELLEELAGASLMVAYHFKSDLARLTKAFPKGVNLATADGMAAFKAGKAQIGWSHPMSVGHGVDGLQDVCNNLAFFGHDWNLELFQQIVERIGPVRQMQSGHDRNVFIHHIIARDTVDELVMARRESKREVQDLLLAAMKGKR